MTNPNVPTNPGAFTTEQLLEDMESTRECFAVVGGYAGTSDELDGIVVAQYHAPVSDFSDQALLDSHLNNSALAPTVLLPVEYPPNFRYEFDAGQEWFQVGRGALLHAADRTFPVRIVKLAFEGFSASWLYHDKRDIKQTTV